MNKKNLNLFFIYLFLLITKSIVFGDQEKIYHVETNNPEIDCSYTILDQSQAKELFKSEGEVGTSPDDDYSLWMIYNHGIPCELHANLKNGFKNLHNHFIPIKIKIKNNSSNDIYIPNPSKSGVRYLQFNKNELDEGKSDVIARYDSDSRHCNNGLVAPTLCISSVVTALFTGYILLQLWKQNHQFTSNKAKIASIEMIFLAITLGHYKWYKHNQTPELAKKECMKQWYLINGKPYTEFLLDPESEKIRIPKGSMFTDILFFNATKFFGRYSIKYILTQEVAMSYGSNKPIYNPTLQYRYNV